jgi:hypothetical protein
MAGGILLLAPGGERPTLDSELNRWIAGNMWIVGAVWQLSALAATIVAYRSRARALALALVGSVAVTAALIYAWATTVAFVGAGAWDILRGVTPGGLYPLLALVAIVGCGALLTLLRAAPRWSRNGTAQVARARPGRS